MSEAYTLMHVPKRLVPTIQGIYNGSLVAVPKEPTRAMEDAALDRDAASEETIYHGIYRAMLAAAQEPPR